MSLGRSVAVRVVCACGKKCLRDVHSASASLKELVPEYVQIRRRACDHSSRVLPLLCGCLCDEAGLDGGVGLEARVAEGAAPGRAERTVFGLRVDPARGEAGVAVGGVAPAAPPEVAALVRDLAPLAVHHVCCDAKRRSLSSSGPV